MDLVVPGAQYRCAVRKSEQIRLQIAVVEEFRARYAVMAERMASHGG
jgi:hypothetical protein